MALFLSKVEPRKSDLQFSGKPRNSAQFLNDHIFIRAYLKDKNVFQDHLFSDKRKFKQLNMTSMIRYEGSYVDSLLIYIH